MLTPDEQRAWAAVFKPATQALMREGMLAAVAGTPTPLRDRLRSRLEADTAQALEARRRLVRGALEARERLASGR